MKKTKKAGSFGVTLEDVKIQVHFNDKVLEFFLTFFVLCLGAFGTIQSFVSSFDFKIDSIGILFYTVFLCLVLYGLVHLFDFIRRKKIIIAALIGTGIAIIVILITLMDQIIMSFHSMIGIMGIGNNMKTSTGPGLFILVLSTFIIVVISYFMILKIKMLPVALFSLSFVGVGFFFGYTPSIFPLTCLGMYLAAVATLTGEKLEYRRPSIQLANAVAVVIFVLYIFSSIVFPKYKYENVDMFHTFIAKLSNIEFDIPLLDFELQATGGINGGKLGKFDKVTFSDVNVLTLTTGEVGRVYLKSFIGADYSDNSWIESSEQATNKYSKLFEEFTRANFDIANQSAELFKIIDNDEELIQYFNEDISSYFKNIHKRDFDVTYVAANGRYFYLPYNNMFYPKIKSAMDGYPIKNENTYISSAAYHIMNPNYQKIKDFVNNYDGENLKVKNYQKRERSYRDFVYDVYLKVDSKYKEELKKIVKDPKFTNEQEKYMLIQSINDYFSKNFTYSLEPGMVPRGKDFLDYFLNESKQGYCTYFASAATMFFRAAGIPARYVEGFAAEVNGDNLISTTEISIERGTNSYSMMENYKEYSVFVKDRDAHAWVEIYQDGFGWVPIEVTLGREEKPQDDFSSESIFTKNLNNPQYMETVENEIPEELEEIQEDVGNLSQVENGSFQGFFSFAKSLLIGLSLLAFTSGIIFVVAILKERKRDQLLSCVVDKDYGLQMNDIYSYVERIFLFYKMHRTSTMSDTDYFNGIKSQYKYLEKCGVDHIMTTILKVRFGKDDLTKEELSEVIEATKKIRKQSYLMQNGLKKLTYRFFYHLY